MENHKLEILAQYSAFRLGCEQALELLENPNASEFDADRVICLLKSILEN